MMKEPQQQSWNLDDVIAGGERATHLNPDGCYYAHLSLYTFAVPFCHEKVVLDAGSGAGYGSAYLAEHGARFVHGVDVSDVAVAFSRDYFQGDNLAFQVMDLERLSGFEPQFFDVLFSSNTLEHVSDIGAFFATACQLLKPDGVAIIAVPPVTSDLLRDLNMANPYHVNIWTPHQWFHVITHYFEKVEIFSHGFDKAGNVPAWHNLGNEKDMSEERFVFAPTTLEAFRYEASVQTAPSITTVFVASQPRLPAMLPDPTMPLPFVDHSFTRLSQEVAFQARIQQQLNDITANYHLQMQSNREQTEALQHEQQRTATLTAAIEQKNQHIRSLETLITQLESGRIMRLLNWLDRLRRPPGK